MADAKTLVKILAWIYIVLSGLGILVGIAMIVGASFIVAYLDPSNTFGGGLLAGLGIFIIALEVFFLWASFQLLAFKSWARILFIVFGALSLLNFPLGTALGVYAIWLLGFNEEAKALFK